MEAEDGFDPLLLQAKQAQRSVLAAYAVPLALNIAASGGKPMRTAISPAAAEGGQICFFPELRKVE